MGKPFITPKTKISELLKEYPELENTLMEFAPKFRKLKNPVLRKTIAAVTTLQQAASVAHVKVEELVNVLRKEAGQEMLKLEEGMGYNMKKPGWFRESGISLRLDARQMLEAGEHPVNQVMAELKGMSSGEIYELRAPFLPAPLIDKAASIHFEHWVREEGPSEFIIFFCRP